MLGLLFPPRLHNRQSCRVEINHAMRPLRLHVTGQHRATHTSDGLDDRDRARLKVDVNPPQPAELATPQARHRSDTQQRVMVARLDAHEECAKFRRRPELHLRRLRRSRRWRCRITRDVVHDLAFAFRVRQCLSDDGEPAGSVASPTPAQIARSRVACPASRAANPVSVFVDTQSERREWRIVRAVVASGPTPMLTRTM